MPVVESYMQGTGLAVCPHRLRPFLCRDVIPLVDRLSRPDFGDDNFAYASASRWCVEREEKHQWLSVETDHISALSLLVQI